MMPGVGFQEMILLALVAIVVIGPRDLPLMMRKFGRFTGKMRALAFEFRQGLDELGRQAELEELRREVQALKKHTGIEELTREVQENRIAIERDVQSAVAEAERTEAPAGSSTPALPEAEAVDEANQTPQPAPTQVEAAALASPDTDAAPKAAKQDAPV